MEQKRVQDKFSWVPLHQRTGRFGFPLSSKEDTRSPLFWLSSLPKKIESGREVFFVNDSDEVLDSVSASSGGFITEDDGALAVGDSGGYRYENVQPGEAVKVEEYDEFYDLDYVLQIYLQIDSGNLGTLEFTTFPCKGGIYEAVLMWNE